MKYILVLAVLSFSTLPKLQAQAMTLEQLQQLCHNLDNEFRAKIIAEQLNNTSEQLPLNYSFISYLDNAYYVNGKSHTSFYSKHAEAGELLRIGVGSFEEKEAYDPMLKRPYILPLDIQETVYFFLNDRLICITQCIGHTGYNSAPSVFWVGVAIADFFYCDTKIIEKKFYGMLGMARALNRNIRANERIYTDEEKHLKEVWDKNEAQLKERAIFLLNMYRL